MKFKDDNGNNTESASETQGEGGDSFTDDQLQAIYATKSKSPSPKNQKQNTLPLDCKG